MPRLSTKPLTATAVKKAKSRSRQYELSDGSTRGLKLRVNPDGRKSFFLRYRLSGGPQRRLKLGEYHEQKFTLAMAREHADHLRAMIGDGRDPLEERKAARVMLKRASERSFTALAHDYLERYAKPNKRSWRADERYINKDLLPVFGDRLVEEIGRRDIMAVLDAKVAAGAPVAANRLRSLLSKIFAFGISRDYLELSPVQNLPRPAPEKARERVLSESEIRSVWNALDGFSPAVAGTFKLRLLTAQRGVEIHSMRWQDIDGDWWTIPAEVVKNKRSHRVPLSPQAHAILEDFRSLTGGQRHVFSSPTARDGHLGAPQRVKARLKRISGVSDFVPHDLRRTAASLMTGMGIERLVVARILNHSDTSVTAIYDRHSYDAEKRRALTRWGDRLEAIVNDRSSADKDVRFV